ncbi:MAG: biotin--[acetyl-CoA-carboxylase] ligase [Candidatus Omnitrophota bacterium]|nr:biotin--[acetyl-CoA-carboxylase] ligase [Candidatus Omnitrophota bacterium]
MLDEKILNVLRNNRDTYVSGEDLTKLADVSRTAIWKHIEKLRAEGYDIEASPHLGYRLVDIPDSLISSEVRWKLNTRILGKAVLSYKKVDSTNDIAYSLAEKGAKEGTVILADEQTKGRGRLGRSWASPSRAGIYLSCILRPKIAPSEIPRITLLAAVALAKAIRGLTGLSATIKWPNDILINDKKVSGILTEMKAEQDKVDFIILGIGVNVNTPPKNLPKGASSIKEEMMKDNRQEAVSRVELTQRILENLEENYTRLKREGFEPIIDEWKDLSTMLGSRVKVVLQNRTFEGQARDLDGDGSLIVRRDSGIMEKVSSGDIIMVR